MTVSIGDDPTAWANNDIAREPGANANPLRDARMGFTHLSPAVAASARRGRGRPPHPLHLMKD